MNSTILNIGVFSGIVSLIGTILGCLIGISLRNPVKFSLFYFDSESHWILRLKRRMECTQFIDYATQRPNITFFIIFLIMYLFRRHVIGSAYMSECKLGLVIHYSC